MTDAMPPVTEAQILSVGDVHIDLRYRRVMRPDGHSELPQRMFDLLQVFLAEPGVLHTRDALFERVWPGVVVEDSNLSQSVWMLRKALGESRKHWIRTVSKRGYVFEPPGPVTVLLTPAVQATSEVVANDASPASPPAAHAFITPPVATAQAASRPPASRAHAARSSLASMLVMLAMWGMLAAAVMLPGASIPGGTQAQVANHARTIVVLQAEPGDARDDTIRARTALLDARLSWKLDLLPEVLRLDALPPRADRAATTHVVVLSSETLPGDGGMALHARIGRMPRGQEIQDITLSERGPREALPGLAEALTQRVIAHVLPHRRDARWPALSLQADIATRYAMAVDAMRRRDWPRAQADAEAVASASPTFAPAHLLLAEMALRQRRNRDALAHASLAQRGLMQLPADAQRILDALSAGLDPRRQIEARRAYAALTGEFPSRPDFALALARLQISAGDPISAHARLHDAAIDWPRTSLQHRVRRQLQLADIAGKQGDLPTARTLAQRTLAELPKQDPGWATERGSARLLLALIHHGETGRAPSPSLFALAADEFRIAGDTMSMRYAHYLADEAQRGEASGETPSMRALLDESRRAGHATIEIEVLRREAYKHYNAGSHVEYRRLLRDALDVANASGDIALQDKLELDLLNQDALMGNHASARARIARLSRGTHTDDRVYWAAEFDAILQQRSGNSTAALAGLRRMEEQRVAHGRPLSGSMAARLSCVRGELHLARGEVASARRQLAGCRHSEQPYLRQWSHIQEAQADLLDGDLPQARVKLGQIERTIDTMPRGTDHWIATESAAELLARAREYDRAERMYVTALPRCEEAGYELLAISMRVGLAEIAMARGDHARSRAIADEARKRAPPDVWVLQRRLQTMDLLDALHNGDTAQARILWTQLKARARRHDDGVLRAELDALARDARFDEAVGARRDTAASPLPGATFDWLSARPLP